MTIQEQLRSGFVQLNDEQKARYMPIYKANIDKIMTSEPGKAPDNIYQIIAKMPIEDVTVSVSQSAEHGISERALLQCTFVMKFKIDGHNAKLMAHIDDVKFGRISKQLAYAVSGLESDRIEYEQSLKDDCLSDILEL
jgi:hypothetical protein